MFDTYDLDKRFITIENLKTHVIINFNKDNKYFNFF